MTRTIAALLIMATVCWGQVPVRCYDAQGQRVPCGTQVGAPVTQTFSGWQASPQQRLLQQADQWIRGQVPQPTQQQQDQARYIRGNNVPLVSGQDPNIVSVNGISNGVPSATCNGFVGEIVEDSTYVVTAAHAMVGQDSFVIGYSDGSSGEGKLIATNAQLDAAVIQAGDSRKQRYKVRFRETPAKIGETLRWLGYKFPDQWTTVGDPNNPPKSLRFSPGRCLNSGSLFFSYQTAHQATHGYSGCPIIDANSYVLGMCVSYGGAKIDPGGPGTTSQAAQGAQLYKFLLDAISQYTGRNTPSKEPPLPLPTDDNDVSPPILPGPADEEGEWRPTEKAGPQVEKNRLHIQAHCMNWKQNNKNWECWQSYAVQNNKNWNNFQDYALRNNENWAKAHGDFEGLANRVTQLETDLQNTSTKVVAIEKEVRDWRKECMEAWDKPPTPEQPQGSDAEQQSEPLILYYTSRGCTECEPLDAKIEEMKTRGWPIVVTRLSPQEAEVQGVPRMYIPSRDKHVVGIRNISSYLSSIVSR